MRFKTDMTTITLRNDFHNAEVRLTCPVQCRHGAWCAYPSAEQLGHVNVALCGLFGCDCGGVRGPQYLDDGRRFSVIAPDGFTTRFERVSTALQVTK